jgi:type II secretion system protein N
VRRIHLGPRTRKIARYAGVTVAAIIVFVFALQMTLPYERAKDKVVDMLADKYDVTIGSVERGWIPGRVYFKAVSLRSRPSQPGEPVTTFYIEKLEGDLGLFALIRGRVSIDLDAKIGAGHISGNVTGLGFFKKGISIDVEGRDLPGASLPMRAVLGLPMTGKIDFAFALDLPNERDKAGRNAPNWTKAEGSVELSCPSSCTFGDGKTRLKPILKNTRNQVMVGEGIDFGKVNLDSLALKAVITPADDPKPAKIEVTKFEARSQDGELKVDFLMTLAPVFSDSMVTGCLRFKGSEGLLKREPKTYAAIQTTGAELRPDGLFHIKLTDRFGDMKRLNMLCGPAANVGNGEDFTAHPSRPNLTVQPDEPIKPVPAMPIPPPEPPRDAAVAPPPPVPARPPGPEGEVPPVGSAAPPSAGPSEPPSAPGGAGTEPIRRH